MKADSIIQNLVESQNLVRTVVKHGTLALTICHPTHMHYQHSFPRIVSHGTPWFVCALLMTAFSDVYIRSRTALPSITTLLFPIAIQYGQHNTHRSESSLQMDTKRDCVQDLRYYLQQLSDDAEDRRQLRTAIVAAS